MGKSFLAVCVCFTLLLAVSASLPVPVCAEALSVQVSIGGEQPIETGKLFRITITVKAPEGAMLNYLVVKTSGVTPSGQCKLSGYAANGSHAISGNYANIASMQIQPAVGNTSGFSWVTIIHQYEVLSGADSNLSFEVTAVTGRKADNTAYYQLSSPISKTILLAGAQPKPHEHTYQVQETKDPTCAAPGYVHYACTGCEDEYRDEMSPLPHSYSFVERVPATCEQPGQDVEQCNVCKTYGTQTQETVPHGHLWDAGHAQPAATCQQPGTLHFSCERHGCTETREEEIPLLEHDLQLIIEPAASCEQPGEQWQRCQACGITMGESATIPALGHKWDEGTVTPGADCEQEGSALYKCLRDGCVVTKTEPILATGHADIMTNRVDATCTQAGEELDICKQCNKTVDVRILPVRGHSFLEEWHITGDDCTRARTRWRACQRDGCEYREEQAVEPYAAHDLIHEQVLASCEVAGENVGRCQRCAHMHRIIVPPKGHQFSLGTVYPVPTCVSPGLRTKTCSVCRVDHTEVLEPTPDAHDYSGAWYIAVKPTCEEWGIQEMACSRKGCDAVNRQPIQPYGHTYRDDWILSEGFDCTTGGIRQRVCTVCGEGVQQESIEAEAHITTPWIPVLSASCKIPGLKRCRCTVCNLVFEEEIPISTLHNSSQYMQVVTHATCSQEGLVARVCLDCGLHLFSMTTQKLPHPFGPWVRRPGGSCEEIRYDDRKCNECDETQARSIPAGQHLFSGKWEERTAPGCLTEGLEGNTCDDCDLYATRPLPATGHAWSELILGRQSTCFESGYMYKECQQCGEIVQQSLRLEPHSFTSWDVTIQNICMQQGLQLRACTNPGCGHMEEEILPQLDHQSEGWEETKPATCTSPGEKQSTCDLCGTVFVSALPMLEHAFGAFEKVYAPLCGQDGLNRRTCADCNATDDFAVPKLWHVWTEWEERTQASCAQEGVRERVCSLCGEREQRATDAEPHRFGAWGGKLYQDCTLGGWQVRSCSGCGAEERRETTAVQHSFTAWQNTTPATCDTPGLQTRQCRRCAHTEERQTAPRKHQMGAWTRGEITDCLEKGRQDHRRCKHCGYEEWREATAYAGHNYTAWRVTAAATCNLPGERERVCRRCNAIEKQSIAHREHQMGAWAQDGMADCLQQGREDHRSCKHCGYEERRAVSYVRHHYAAWRTITPATCGASGERERVCRRCGVTETQVTAARKHTYGRWVDIEKTSCNHPGTQERTCKHCGEVERRETKLLKHVSGPWKVSKAAQLFKPGTQSRLCKRCGETLATRGYSAPKSAFAVSFCSLGFRLRDINPQHTDSWYMLTPIRLTEEGMTQLPLIADDKHVVGTIFVEVSGGKVTVTHELFDERTEILRPSIRFFSQLDGLSDKELERTAHSTGFGRAISIKRSFADADVVFMSVRCEGVYDVHSDKNPPFSDDGLMSDGTPYARALKEFQAMAMLAKEDE